MVSEYIAYNKKIDWPSAFAGALAGSVLTFVLVTTWFANAVVETGKVTTASKMQSCILKITPLMANETKAEDWCGVANNRNAL